MKCLLLLTSHITKWINCHVISAYFYPFCVFLYVCFLLRLIAIHKQIRINSLNIAQAQHKSSWQKRRSKKRSVYKYQITFPKKHSWRVFAFLRLDKMLEANAKRAEGIFFDFLFFFSLLFLSLKPKYLYVFSWKMCLYLFKFGKCMELDGKVKERRSNNQSG